MLSAIPAGRVFGLDSQTVIGIAIQLFNACVLALALSFILYKPVQKFLRDRSERIGSQISRAEETMAKANALIAQYEQKIELIEQERFDILEAARKQAAEASRETLHEAKREADAIRERGYQDIKKEIEQAREGMRLQIIEVSLAMAEKLLSQTIDTNTHELLFAETLRDLEDSVWPG